jgi:hypothetical protein
MGFSKSSDIKSVRVENASLFQERDEEVGIEEEQLMMQMERCLGKWEKEKGRRRKII